MNYLILDDRISLGKINRKTVLRHKNALHHKEILNKTKLIGSRSLLMILGIIFGVLITAQWNSIPDRITNPIAPYASLKETRDSLYEEQDQLKEEIKALQASIQKEQKDSENKILSKDQIAKLRLEKAKAGLLKLNGPGLIITLDDSSSNSTEESIVHAADLRDIINLLWGSGAEAISVNSQRVVVNTAVDCIVNTIMVNNTRIGTPFRIEVIGDQNRMLSNLNNPLILSDIHQRKSINGLTYNIDKNNDITVPVYDGGFEIKNEEGAGDV